MSEEMYSLLFIFSPLLFLCLMCHGGTAEKSTTTLKIDDLTGDVDLFMQNIDAHNEEAMSILSGLLSSKNGWKFVPLRAGDFSEKFNFVL